IGLPYFKDDARSLNRRIPIESFLDACESLNRYHSDPLTCFKVASRLTLHEIGPWAYFMIESFSLRQAFDTFIDNYHLFGNFGQPEWMSFEQSSGLVCEYPFAQLSRLTPLLEIRCAVLASFARLMTKQLYPDLVTKICFQHDPSADKKRYEEVCNCPVEFKSAVTGFFVADKYLDLKINSPDENLRGAFKDKIVKLFSSDSTNSLAFRIEKHLASLMPAHVDRKLVAKEMGMSESTMKRRLSDEGTNFKEILIKVKNEAARRLLYEGELRVSEIAECLGFSCVSSFSQRFRQLNGVSPRQFQSRACEC
ncbi:MAG: AraC family transcriptional regulator, partial [Kangiellaceae bacterium]|nr:AraC family transcriptional regulator [Kangiellaceae bacterium]